VLQQIYATGGVVALALAGLIVSNIISRWEAAGKWARRSASALGGAAYLVAALWLDAMVAIRVLSALTLLIVILRLGLPRLLRGVKGSRPSQAWSEITFAVAGTLSLAAGWWALGDRWLGFLPVAFMAWGDNAAGVVRDIWQSLPWPLSSAAMLAVCLVAAALMQPYWIGAVGAIVATVAERYRPRLSFWDDNLNLVTASFAAMAVLAELAS
jgi:hypothetical protein